MKNHKVSLKLTSGQPNFSARYTWRGSFEEMKSDAAAQVEAGGCGNVYKILFDGGT